MHCAKRGWNEGDGLWHDGHGLLAGQGTGSVSSTLTDVSRTQWGPATTREKRAFVCVRLMQTREDCGEERRPKSRTPLRREILDPYLENMLVIQLRCESSAGSLSWLAGQCSHPPVRTLLPEDHKENVHHRRRTLYQSSFHEDSRVVISLPLEADTLPKLVSWIRNIHRATLFGFAGEPLWMAFPRRHPLFVVPMRTRKRERIRP